IIRAGGPMKRRFAVGTDHWRVWLRTSFNQNPYSISAIGKMSGPVGGNMHKRALVSLLVDNPCRCQIWIVFQQYLELIDVTLVDRFRDCGRDRIPLVDFHID